LRKSIYSPVQREFIYKWGDYLRTQQFKVKGHIRQQNPSRNQKLDTLNIQNQRRTLQRNNFKNYKYKFLKQEFHKF